MPNSSSHSSFACAPHPIVQAARQFRPQGGCPFIDLSPGIGPASCTSGQTNGAWTHCFDQQTHSILLPSPSPVIRLTFCFLFDTVRSGKSGRICAFRSAHTLPHFKEKAYLR
jgi:hypothetical protein